MNFLNSLGFSLLINQPTRIFHYEGSDNVSCSSIDHIITNNSSAFTKTGILIAEVSDHLPVFGIMSLSKPCKNPFKNTFRRVFSENKKEQFVSKLKENLDYCDLNVGPNLLMDKILLSIKDATEKNISFEESVLQTS